MNNDNISIDALRKAADALNQDLGDISDLDDELANTLVNIYYRFFANIEYMLKDSKSSILEPYFSSLGRLVDTFQNYNNFNAETTAGFETAQQFIKAVRDARLKGPQYYLFLQIFTLDILKYNIVNANTKSAMRRAMERKFKKPREISNLLKMMQNLHQANKNNSKQEFKSNITSNKHEVEKSNFDIRINKLLIRIQELEQETNKARKDKNKELAVKVYDELLTVLVPEAESLIIDSKNNNAFAHYCLGVILRILCIYQDAVSEFQICLSADPEFYDALLEITGCLAQSGNLAAAEEYAKKATKVEPNEAAAWGNLAMVLIQKGSKSDAFDAISRAMKLNPNDEINRNIFENFERYFA